MANSASSAKIRWMPACSMHQHCKKEGPLPLPNSTQAALDARVRLDPFCKAPDELCGRHAKGLTQ
eukprot:348477-Lingulodinium_polyedra.AAC.1